MSPFELFPSGLCVLHAGVAPLSSHVALANHMLSQCFRGEALHTSVGVLRDWTPIVGPSIATVRGPLLPPA